MQGGLEVLVQDIVKTEHNSRTRMLSTRYERVANQYCIAGLFDPTEPSFFSFSKLQKRKLSARSGSIRLGVDCVVDVRAKNETDQVGFPPKALKFGCTKQTRYGEMVATDEPKMMADNTN